MTAESVFSWKKRQSGSATQGYSFYLNNGILGFQLADDAGVPPTDYSSGTKVPSDGKWHLVAVTVERNNPAGGNFYLDGFRTGPAFDPTLHSGSVSTDFPLRVGSFSSSVGGLFIGSIDEVEVFCHAVPASDILTIWQAQSGGKCKEACGINWDRHFNNLTPDMLSVSGDYR